MFCFDNFSFRYEPYPIGGGQPFFDKAVYEQLTDRFPPLELFATLPEHSGKKYSLSERFNPRAYDDFVRADPLWREFHSRTKSPAFVREVLALLARHHINYRTRNLATSLPETWWLILRDMARGRIPYDLTRLKTRFEFSAFADGGYLLPHTDTPKKRIVMVMSMAKEGEWLPEFGGHTVVNRPLQERHAYNWSNEFIPFDQVEEIDRFPYLPNQCLMFVKTFNSLHAVSPVQTAGAPVLRKTLTLNIEVAH